MESKIVVVWENEDKKIISWIFYDDWNEFDYFSAIHASNQLIKLKSCPVHVFIDTRHSLKTPRNIFQLARSGFQQRPSNIGYVLVINRSNFWKNLYYLFKRMYPMPLHICFAETKDRAYAILQDLQKLNRQFV